jgi:hypothetical protein
VAVATSFACSDGAATGGGIPRKGYGSSGGTSPGGQTSDGTNTDPGGNNPSPNPTNNPNPTPSPTAAIAINLDKSSASTDLLAETTVLVNVQPQNGFNGNVDLSVTGAPAGVTCTFDKTTVTINGASASATLTLKAASDTAPATQSLTITAKSGSLQATAPLSLTINPVVHLKIPASVDALRGPTDTVIQSTAYGPNPLNLKLGTAANIAIKIFNEDTKAHEIHAGNGAQGFAHGNNIPAGTEEGNTQANVPRTVNAPGTYNFYLHDGTNGRTVSGRIIVTQ